MIDFIVIAIIAIILAAAITYIIKAKKSGAKCIGCPAANQYSSEHHCSCGCSGCSGCHDDNK